MEPGDVPFGAEHPFLGAVRLRRWGPLVEVQDEFYAVEAALRRVDDLSLVQSVGADARTFGRARQRLEATYLVRLVSAFEGILREEFDGSEEGLYALVERAVVQKNVPRSHADAAHEVRRQRNRIVHPATPVYALRVPFGSAFRSLQTFVNRL